MTLKELFEKRQKAFMEARKFSADHAADWTEERDAQYKKMIDEVNKLGADMERVQAEERVAAELAGYEQSAGRGVPPANPAGPDAGSVVTTATPEYRAAWVAWLRSRNEAELRSMNITVDPSGGYMVPDELHQAMVRALTDYLPMRDYATVIQTNSALDIVYDNDDGVAYWVAEEGTRQDSDATVGLRKLTGHSEQALQKVSRALLQDSVFDIGTFVSEGFGRRFAKLEQPAFTTGNGIGKPTGFITDATVGKTSAAALVIEADEIMDFFFSVKAEYRGQAIWQMNDSTLAEIAKLKDGAGRYIWQLALAPGKPDTILGRPIVANSSMATVAASAKVIAFGDFGFYWIVDRGTPIVQRLVELYAITGQDGFLQEKRVDGRLMVDEAVKVFQMAA